MVPLSPEGEGLGVRGMSSPTPSPLTPLPPGERGTRQYHASRRVHRRRIALRRPQRPRRGQADRVRADDGRAARRARRTRPRGEGAGRFRRRVGVRQPDAVRPDRRLRQVPPHPGRRLPYLGRRRRGPDLRPECRGDVPGGGRHVRGSAGAGRGARRPAPAGALPRRLHGGAQAVQHRDAGRGRVRGEGRAAINHPPQDGGRPERSGGNGDRPDGAGGGRAGDEFAESVLECGGAGRSAEDSPGAAWRRGAGGGGGNGRGEAGGGTARGGASRPRRAGRLRHHPRRGNPVADDHARPPGARGGGRVPGHHPADR